MPPTPGHDAECYWIDPGSNDCQPRCGRRVGAGAEEPPPERSLLLLDVLLELLLVDGHSRFSPSASPPLLVLLSRGLALSIVACGELSTSWVSRLAAAALPIPAMHKAQPINQRVARMAIELPDPQAKTWIVSETLAPCQCCRF
ncbi:hypothetical protein GCM10008098_00860 [Rhodanobacter panaciterrae]|uniref:Uncharacterized protein n=1 Tax=Rhodanobacter panaciterrae TaxID=490572 RepID=A0ABQ2ZH33_9GAMM|nr:hypothetical protein GCM10008098_00860 [Rhodanobacter panaciterrae]